MFRIRLKELRENAGLSQSTFAKAFGVAQSTVGGWESGAREPNIETIQKLADFFTVSTDYLFSGDTSSTTPGTPFGVPLKKGIKIPVLGRVRAGFPAYATEEILDYEEITQEMASSGEFFALQVKGDSMEPRFIEGDVVIIKRQPDVESGEISVVLVDGEDSTLKRVNKHKDGISLIPLNSSYPPIFYSNREIRELPVQILGKVVELRGKF